MSMWPTHDTTRITQDLHEQYDGLPPKMVTAIASFYRGEYELVVLDDDNNDITESLDSDEVDLLWTEILNYRQGEEEDARERDEEMRRERDDD